MRDSNPLSRRTRKQSTSVPGRSGPIHVGVIEVGSRALRLLVADISRGSGLVPIWTDHKETQIGSLDLNMTPEKLAELRTSIGQFKEDAASWGAKKIMIFGTEALRELASRRGFDVAAIGAEIEILNPRTEAFYSFIAAVKGMPGQIQNRDSVLIMDQGARSFEIAIGKAGCDTLTSFASLELGSENLMRLFRDCRSDMSAFRHSLSDVFGRLTLPAAASVERVVGLGSVATKSVWLAASPHRLQPYDALRVHGKSLTVGGIDGMVTRLGGLARNIDPRNPAGEEIEPLRLLTGLTAFREFLRCFGKDRFLVSAHGTRYGAAWQLALSQSSPAKSPKQNRPFAGRAFT